MSSAPLASSTIERMADRKHLNRIDATQVDSLRTWGFDQLLLLIRNHSVPKEEAWIVRVLEFLLVHGLFSFEKSDRKSAVHAVSW